MITITCWILWMPCRRGTGAALAALTCGGPKTASAATRAGKRLLGRGRIGTPDRTPCRPGVARAAPIAGCRARIGVDCRLSGGPRTWYLCAGCGVPDDLLHPQGLL